MTENTRVIVMLPDKGKTYRTPGDVTLALSNHLHPFCPSGTEETMYDWYRLSQDKEWEEYWTGRGRRVFLFSHNTLQEARDIPPTHGRIQDILDPEGRWHQAKTYITYRLTPDYTEWKKGEASIIAEFGRHPAVLVDLFWNMDWATEALI